VGSTGFYFDAANPNMDSESGKFEVWCDGPTCIGGTDKYPSAMTYLAQSIGFCLLTQIARYSCTMKMNVSDPKCRVVMRKHLGGSVLKTRYLIAGKASTPAPQLTGTS